MLEDLIKTHNIKQLIEESYEINCAEVRSLSTMLGNTEKRCTAISAALEYSDYFKTEECNKGLEKSATQLWKVNTD